MIARCRLNTLARHPESIKLETAVVCALQERVEIEIFQNITAHITIEGPDVIVTLPFVLALKLTAFKSSCSADLHCLPDPGTVQLSWHRVVAVQALLCGQLMLHLA